MAQLDEIALQCGEQRTLGAALEHFCDKSSARLQNLRCDGECVLGESHDP